jgi:Protein tyrosine and serine/threonine kinase
MQVKILTTLQECPNVVRLHGTYESEQSVMVVMEQCCGGDLQKLSDVSAWALGGVRERASAEGTGAAPVVVSKGRQTLAHRRETVCPPLPPGGLR